MTTSNITKDLKIRLFTMCYDLLENKGLTESERQAKAYENVQNLINLGIETGELF